MEWVKVEGSQEEKPLELDMVSSPTTVYLRRNIERVRHTDEDGNEYEMWEYEEVSMSKEDYIKYKEEI